jgi:hypothetical protein
VDVRFVDETEFGIGWIAAEPAFLQRCSHAVAADGGVWVFDPVAGDGVVERIRALGEPAGVVVLFGRHERDSARVARELGVRRFTPSAPPPLDAPFQLVRIGRGELAAWFPEHRALVVSEALGTVQYMRAPGEQLGLHPFRRLVPPRRLNAFDPEHLLVGHGAGLHGPEAAAALHDVLDNGPARTFAWLWSGFSAHVLGRRSR